MPYKDAIKQNEYQKKYLEERRQKWINENGPCKYCGLTTDLEVDHIDPKTKLLNPTRIWGLSSAKRNIELSKCQVLCVTCHKKKTKKDLGVPNHGTGRMYAIGCKCALCRRWQSDRVKRHRLLGTQKIGK